MVHFLNPPSSPFEPPSFIYRICSAPVKTAVQYLYSLLIFLRGPSFSPPSLPSRIRLVCMSDTHTHKPTGIPFGDVLIHAGDLTNNGSALAIQEQIDWISSMPHPYKIVIAGNHDSFFDPRSRRAEDVARSIDWKNVHYLQHSSITIKFAMQGNRRLTFYGAPQIPRCGGKDFAFQYRQTDDAWSGTIPKETDVLVTHSPPKCHLDLPAGLGCSFLLQEVWKVRPKVHVFGHVHAGYGRQYVFWDQGQQAFERICERETLGLLKNLLSINLWLDVVSILRAGLSGILWNRGWGGESNGGLMINASLMYRNTGKLGNHPQVIDI